MSDNICDCVTDPVPSVADHSSDGIKVVHLYRDPLLWTTLIGRLYKIISSRTTEEGQCGVCKIAVKCLRAGSVSVCHAIWSNLFLTDLTFSRPRVMSKVISIRNGGANEDDLLPSTHYKEKLSTCLITQKFDIQLLKYA